MKESCRSLMCCLENISKANYIIENERRRIVEILEDADMPVVFDSDIVDEEALNASETVYTDNEYYEGDVTISTPLYPYSVERDSSGATLVCCRFLSNTHWGLDKRCLSVPIEDVKNPEAVAVFVCNHAKY